MGSRKGFTLIEVCIVVTMLSILVALVISGCLQKREAVAWGHRMQDELLLVLTLDALAKKPMGFWANQFACESFCPDTHTVVFNVRKNMMDLAIRMRFDESSYAFIEAHKDESLVKMVELWRAEQQKKK